MNDIIGGPVPVIVKGRVFQFSPLNDLETSSLDAWILWANDGVLDSAVLSEARGAARLLYYSIARTDKLSAEACYDFIADDIEAIHQVLDAWTKLNTLPEITIAGSNQPIDKDITYDDVYINLSTKYGWTPQQISLLTSYQQLAYLGHTPKPNLTFDTEEEYQEWLLNVNRRKQSTDRPNRKS